MFGSESERRPGPDEPSPEEVAADPAVLRAERRLELLAELTEIGMKLARSLRPNALAGPAAAEDKSPDPGRDPVDAFARVSRAVRLTLALEARTEKELRDLKAGVARRLAEESVRAKVRHEKQIKARRERVEDLVVEAMDRESELPELYTDMLEALQQRLEWDHAYEQCEDRPLRETVERLCHDICISPDWSRWAGEGWAPADPPERPTWSEFRQPSAKPYDLFGDADDPPPDLSP